MSLPWFRFYTEWATDPVVQSLAFEDQRHYVVLLCLKGSGVLDRDIPESNRERIILRTLGLDSRAGDEAKRRLVEVGLVSLQWQPTAWDKRQFVSDNSTDRVRKHRKSKGTGNVSETLHVTGKNRSGNAPDTDPDTELPTRERRVGEEVGSTTYAHAEGEPRW